MSGEHLTKRQIAWMRARRKEGVTVAEIARRTRRSRNTVSRHTADVGSMPNGWQHRTLKQELEVVGLSSRHTQLEIAALTGLSQAVVHAVQRKYHIVSRFGRQHVAARRYAYDEHMFGRVVEELYSERRMTQQQVADMLSIDVSTLRRRMEALGFRIRTTAESNTGKKHGHRHRYDLPDCATPDCVIRVGLPGERHCAQCRRKIARGTLSP